MAFSTPFTSTVITDLGSGAYELLSRDPSEAQSGWDTMRDTYLLRHDPSVNDPMAILEFFSNLWRGARVGSLNMWIVSRTPKLLAPGLAQVDIVSMGLLSPRGYKVSYDSQAATQNAVNVYTPDGNFAKVSVRESAVTATLESVLFGVTPGSLSFPTANTGRSRTLPPGWTPAVAGTVWANLTTYTYNWPNGWVYEGASCENLPGLTNVWLVKEKYAYQYPKTPG